MDYRVIGERIYLEYELGDPARDRYEAHVLNRLAERERRMPSTTPAAYFWRVEDALGDLLGIVLVPCRP